MRGNSFDFRGHARPGHVPLGWKWFGSKYGWQPCAWFKIPSASFVPPEGWNAGLAVWWRPVGQWDFTFKGGIQIPSWWQGTWRYYH